jgi:hypothetical protein
MLVAGAREVIEPIPGFHLGRGHGHGHDHDRDHRDHHGSLELEWEPYVELNFA